MTVIEYYLRALEELAAGSRTPPEGISLTEEDPMARAAQLQTQIQAIGICEFVRRCAAQDGQTLPQEAYDSFREEDLVATLAALAQASEAPAEETPAAEADPCEPPKIDEPDGPRSAY